MSSAVVIVLLASCQNWNSLPTSVWKYCWPLLLSSLPILPFLPKALLNMFPKFFFLWLLMAWKLSKLIGDENSEQHSPNTLGIRVLPSTYERRKIRSLAHVECCGKKHCSLGVRTTVQEYSVVTCMKTWPPWELQQLRKEILDCSGKAEDAVSLEKNGNCIDLR